jgi:chromate reductase
VPEIRTTSHAAGPAATDLSAGRETNEGVQGWILRRKPFVYIQYSPELFTGDGQVKDETMKAFLAGYMAEFRDHIVRVLTVLPRTARALQ